MSHTNPPVTSLASNLQAYAHFPTSRLPSPGSGLVTSHLDWCSSRLCPGPRSTPSPPCLASPQPPEGTLNTCIMAGPSAQNPPSPPPPLLGGGCGLSLSPRVHMSKPSFPNSFVDGIWRWTFAIRSLPWLCPLPECPASSFRSLLKCHCLKRPQLAGGNYPACPAPFPTYHTTDALIFQIVFLPFKMSGRCLKPIFVDWCVTLT